MNSRKHLKGIVLDSKMDKTAIVEVSRKVSHPVYKKYIIKSKQCLPKHVWSHYLIVGEKI